MTGGNCRPSRRPRPRWWPRPGPGGDKFVTVIMLRTFTAQHAAHVRLHDLAETLPTVAAALL